MSQFEDAGAEPADGRPVGRPRARITDVAARAGVSIKTVSRVANDEPSVSDKTRAHVLEVIHELGFVPNMTARSLKTGDHDAIGVVIDAISDPFFADLVSVIEDLALKRGMSVLFASTGFDAVREREQLQRLVGHQLRGLIVAPVGISAEYLQMLRHRFPVVAADRSREGIDSVVIDDFGAAYEATQHLISFGHERIGFIGEDPTYPTNSARLAGFRAALSEANIAVDESLVVRHESPRSAMASAAAELLAREDAPTALFSATARASIATMDAIRAAGISGLAFISFGDFELADVFTPGITCIDQDPRLIATAVFERLLELLEDPSSPPRNIVVPTRLIRRGSGELPPRSATLASSSQIGFAS